MGSRRYGGSMIELARRRMMMGGSAKPYDAEVEWIASDGATAIDTGIYPSNRLGVHLEMWLPAPDATYGHWLFGARTDVNNGNYALLNLQAGNNSSSWRCGSIVNQATGRRIVQGRIIIDNVINPFALSVRDANGTFTYTSPNVQTFISPRTLWLYTLHLADGQNPQSANNYTDTRIYGGSKLYLDSTTLIGDYIPVRKDGKGYLYDKVTQQLLPNVGANNLTYGPDV